MATVQIRLDTIGRQVTLDETAAEIVRQELERRDAAAEEKASLFEKMKKEADAAQAKIDEFKSKMDEALGMMEKMKGEKDAEVAAKTDAIKRADAAEAKLSDPAQLRQILAPRVALETQARAVLPQDQHARVDAMSDDEIRRAVVGVVLPQVKLDAEVKGERLAGLYEGAVANIRTDAAPRTPPPAQTRTEHTPRANGGGGDLAAQQRARIDSDYIPPGGRKPTT